MKNLRYVLCDVFTERALTGNGLAVFTDGRGVPDTTMQAIAREMNLSETVFVLPPQSGGHAKIRIFTPRLEIPFAGHPTLGSAFVLGGPLQTDLVELETGAGTVPVRLTREQARIVFGWMLQPVPKWSPFPEADALLAALGVSASRLPVTAYDNGPRTLLVLLDSVEEVAALEPNLVELERLTRFGVSVSAGSGLEWKTRMFAPAAGVPEDPATGSAAGPLAVHLARHGLVPFGEVIEIRQGDEIQRPSMLSAVAHGSAENIERVEVGGPAVIVGRGELRVPL
jgi:trans-2,3-dihydro-3-hydroxyanthranilate isomerase